jgi:hypothetical protein
MKKIISISFTIIGIVVIGMMSCSKASEDLLQSSSPIPCDTTSIKYSTDVVPILQNNCYTCHGTNSNDGSGGIVLEGYANLSPWAFNGVLVGNITHAPGFNPMPMPIGTPMLPDCEINTITAWVNQGVLNN